MVAMASEKKLKLAFISKYVLSPERISGTGNFSYYLCRELNKKTDLTVIIGKNKTFEQSPDKNFKFERTGFPFSLRSGLIARKYGKDVVVFCSGITGLNLLALYLVFLKIILVGRKLILFQLTEPDLKGNSFLFRLVVPFVKKIVCTNRVIEEHFGKIAFGKTALVYPGIDTNKIKPIARPANKKPRIGYFGYFLDDKGPDKLVAAFKKVKPNAELFIVGKSKNDTKIENTMLQTAKNDPNIKFFGYQDNVLKMMNTCDIIVFPFRWSKCVLGLALTAIEAMALEKAVIVSNVSVLTPLIEDKKNGLVFSTDKELEQALSLLCKNSALRKKLGVAARKTVKEKFSVSSVSKDFLQVCNKVAEGL